MTEPTFVRVFRPADAQQVTEARIALEGSGIPFFIQGEQFLGMTGLPFSFGRAETWVAVAEEDADGRWLNRRRPYPPPTIDGD